MSDASLNPYQSEYYPAPTPVSSESKRPIGLIVFCVIVIVFASMGMMGNIATGVIYMVNGGAANYAEQYGKESPVQWHPDLLKKLMVLSPAHSTRNLGILFCSLFVDFLLLVAASAALMRKSWGQSLFAVACVLSIFMAIGQATIVTMTSGELRAAMAEHGEQVLVPNGENGDANMAEMMGRIMSTTFQIMPAIMWGWSGLKIIFYVSLFLYLRKKNVRAYFLAPA